MSRLASSAAYPALVATGGVALGLVAIGVDRLLWERSEVPSWYLPLVLLFGVLVGLPIDKWADERFRSLVREDGVSG